jgi:N-acetylneuraminic acid mutarotase
VLNLHPSRPLWALAIAFAAVLAACSGEDSPLAPDVADQVGKTPVEGGAPQVVNAWFTKPAMPAARHGMVAASVNGFIYLIGGGNSDGKTVATVDRFNPINPSQPWTAVAPMPQPRYMPSGAAVIGSKIYVTGGFDTLRARRKTLYVYNISTNKWTKRASIPVPSAEGVSGMIGGKLYVYSPGSGESFLHRYDPSTNTWTQRAKPPKYFSAVSGGVINGKLYVAGGAMAGESPAVGTLLVYNPSNNSWQTKATMPTPRLMAGYAVMNGKLYVVGGFSGEPLFETKHAVEAYDPVTNIWSARANMITARRSLAAAVVNGTLYALGGVANTHGEVTTNEAYVP